MNIVHRPAFIRLFRSAIIREINPVNSRQNGYPPALIIDLNKITKDVLKEVKTTFVAGNLELELNENSTLVITPENEDETESLQGLVTIGNEQNNLIIVAHSLKELNYNTQQQLVFI